MDTIPAPPPPTGGRGPSSYSIASLERSMFFHPHQNRQAPAGRLTIGFPPTSVGFTMINLSRFAAVSAFGLLGAASALAQQPSASPVPMPAGAAAPAAAQPGSCPAILHRSFKRLQDETPQDLCQYAGKVVLVVNTASYCGYTKQYEGLEALHAKYAGKGLVVLGFPSNDFGKQEPGSNKEIAEFCYNTYGVKFPMFAKTAVSGSAPNPLYADLIKATGKAPGWNFHKYLIGRDGKVIENFPSKVTPQDKQLVGAIEKALAS
jgi:glutathione peroxidase